MKRISRLYQQLPARLPGCCAILLLIAIFVCTSVQAEDTDHLAIRILSLKAQIAEVTGQQEQEKQLNQDLVSKARESQDAMKNAYASAERLNTLNARLNQLNEQHTAVCNEWKSVYRKTVDTLLVNADRESDAKIKGEIGKQLQRLQKQNLELCPDSRSSAIPPDWQSIRAETYDGPEQLAQKIQLLNDIRREMNIQLAKLDRQIAEFQKEQKTKERAEEFVQESALFTDHVTLRRLPGSADTPTSGPVLGEAGSGSPQIVSGDQPLGKEQVEQFELQYHQQKKELQSQQKDLQLRIAELQKRMKELEIP